VPRLGEDLTAGFRIKQTFIETFCVSRQERLMTLPINENVYGPLIALSRIGRDEYDKSV